MLKIFLTSILATSALFAQDEGRPEKPASLPHTFSWPFIEASEMSPRGGTTTGSSVTPRTDPKQAWLTLQNSDASGREKDRLAILALAGSYRVSFDFIETLGFSPNYAPPAPYFSWATEHVSVLTDEPGFISLQHTLVMFFEKDGEVSEPMLMKHWRQDWTYEDTELMSYSGPQTWKKEPSQDASGRWSQAVYQVDDSPRYEVMGTWEHGKDLSSWRSDKSWRPLPRREFSVRDDYNVLEGFHEITLSPTGWIHVQNNRKLMVGDDTKYVGTEVGAVRYEEITSPELKAPFEDNWTKAAPYWAASRAEWARIFSEHDSFTLKTKDEYGKKLFSRHFSFASEVAKAAAESPKSPEELAAHAKETIADFIEF